MNRHTQCHIQERQKTKRVLKKKKKRIHWKVTNYSSFIFASYWRASNCDPSGANPAISTEENIKGSSTCWGKINRTWALPYQNPDKQETKSMTLYQKRFQRVKER